MISDEERREVARRLRELARRIDDEMVELPKDRDGVLIRVGDTVHTADGRKADVIRICVLRNSVLAKCSFTDGTITLLNSHALTHNHPDSFERIAEDIEVAEKWCDQNGDYGTGISSVGESTLRGWADRIRKLAEKEGE